MPPRLLIRVAMPMPVTLVLGRVYPEAGRVVGLAAPGVLGIAVGERDDGRRGGRRRIRASKFKAMHTGQC